MPNELYYVLCVIDYCNIVSRKPVMDMRTCIIIGGLT